MERIFQRYFEPSHYHGIKRTGSAFGGRKYHQGDVIEFLLAVKTSSVANTKSGGGKFFTLSE